MPGSQTLALTEIKLEIGGQPAPAEMLGQVLEVVVDQQVRLPSMFTLRLEDKALKWVDASQLEIGKEISIAVTAAGSGTHDPVSGPLFKGEITALEPDYARDGSVMLVVRGYDKLHRLHRGRQTRSFLEMTDADAVKKAAGEAGLAVKTDVTSPTHKYILQNNQTNLEFVQERAARHGYQVFVAEGTLNFVKGAVNQGAGPTLKLGENLVHFQPRLTAARQADKVEVRGWDPAGKREFVAQATPSAAPQQAGLSQAGGAVAKKAFGAAKVILVNRPVATVDDAQALAQAEAEAISASFLQAEGSCLGDPRLQAGRTVTLEGLGARFSGQYHVTAATHVIKTGGDYLTHFAVSGTEAPTISQLVAPAGPPAGEFGVVIAVVTNLSDPDKLGRVKVKFPWLGDNVESAWARVASPSAGSGYGLAYLPEVNDEVLVAFEHGDIHRPYILGSLWNGTDKPPEGDKLVDGGKVVQRVIKSRSGHLIILDDTDGAEKIIIRDKTGENEIEIASADKTLKIKIGGDVTLEAKGAIALKSPSKDITLDCANFKVKASQNVTVEASSNLDLKATSNCTVQGTAGVTVKNAAAQVALSGPTVNINNGALEVM